MEIDRRVCRFIALSGMYNRMHASHVCESGPPRYVVPNNGPAFLSEVKEIFLKKNDLKRMLVLLYHLASNGVVESSVQTTKAKLQNFGHGAQNCTNTVCISVYAPRGHQVLPIRAVDGTEAQDSIGPAAAGPKKNSPPETTRSEEGLRSKSQTDVASTTRRRGVCQEYQVRAGCPL